MARRYYANAAPQRTLAGTITAGATSLTVSGSFAGWPVQFPFYAALDIGTASFELVSVTNIVGSTATIVRAQDGTAAISHPGGATMDQVIVRQDLDEASAHINASAGVHGVSGSVVGTNDVQTVSNKTLTNPTINGANVTGTIAGTLAASGLTITSPNLVTPSSTKSTHTGDATTAAVTAQAGATNTLIVSLKDNTGTQVGTIDAVAGVSATKLTGAVIPKSFATEAAATTALPSTAVGTTVWLTAPTTGPVGLFVWNGTAWLPHVVAGQRLQYTQTGAQALTNGSFVALTNYAAADVDTFGGSTFNATTGVWTCPATGNYEISGQVSATGALAVRLIAAIFKNGAAVYSSWQSGAPTFLATASLVPKELALVSGDTITLQAQPNAAGVSTGTSNGNSSFLRIKRV